MLILSKRNLHTKSHHYSPRIFLFTLILHSKVARSMWCWHRLLVIDGENLILTQYCDIENCEFLSDCITKANSRWVEQKHLTISGKLLVKNRFFHFKKFHRTHPGAATIWNGNWVLRNSQNSPLPCSDDSRCYDNKWDLHSWVKRKTWWSAMLSSSRV